MIEVGVDIVRRVYQFVLKDVLWGSNPASAIKPIKSPKQRLETYCFCSVSYYYYYSSFFPLDMKVSVADLRNY